MFRRRSPFVRIVAAASVIAVAQGGCIFGTSNPPPPDSGLDTDDSEEPEDTDADDTDDAAT